jgi:hypothetical protein
MNVTAGYPLPHDRPDVARGDPMNPLEMLVQARLDDLHAQVGAARSRRAAARSSATRGADLRRALRIRIGRGLVAIGAAVAGEEHQVREHRTA